MTPEVLPILNRYFLGIDWQEVRDNSSNELVGELTGYQGSFEKFSNILPHETIQVIEVNQDSSRVYRVSISGFYLAIKSEHTRLDSALAIASRQYEEVIQSIAAKVQDYQVVGLKSVVDDLLIEFNQQHGSNLQIEGINEHKDFKGAKYQELTLVDYQQQKRFKLTARASSNHQSLEELKSTILSQVRSMMR